MSHDEQPLGQRNYRQFADRYTAQVEHKPHNAYYELPATFSLLPPVAGMHVLDAGCGPGHKSAWLLEQGAQVTAVDVTPEFLAVSRERIGDRATVLNADLARPLEFASDEIFDVVLCALVLDYIEDWRPVMKEFARTLRPGGQLVFSCTHPLADILLWERKAIPDWDYFATQYFELQWSGFGEPRPTVGAYRRSMGQVLAPVLEAGLIIDRVLEPQPTEQFQQTSPEDHERLMREPGFLCVRARKVGPGCSS